MGAAEDAVTRRQAQQRYAASQAQIAEAAPFIAEVRQLLIPQIIAMLQACDYNYGPASGLYSHSFFSINGVDRVAWKVWSDGWESGPESHITANGEFILGRSQHQLSTPEELVVHHGTLLLPQLLENLRRMARGETLH